MNERVAEPPVVATPAALDAIARMVARRGPLMFFQSGGCCDGSLPMCLPANSSWATTTSSWVSWAAAPSTSTGVNTRCGSTPSSSSTSARGSPKGSPSRRGTADTSSPCPGSVRPASSGPGSQRAGPGEVTAMGRPTANRRSRTGSGGPRPFSTHPDVSLARCCTTRRPLFSGSRSDTSRRATSTT